MWWDLTKADFAPDLDGYVEGLGCLRLTRVSEFRVLVTEIQLRVRALRTTRIWEDFHEKGKELIDTLSAVLADYFNRISSLVMTFQAFAAECREFPALFLGASWSGRLGGDLPAHDHRAPITSNDHCQDSRSIPEASTARGFIHPCWVTILACSRIQ